MTMAYQICQRCILDTTDPEIRFDQNGYCNHCAAALQRIQRQLLPSPAREAALRALTVSGRLRGRREALALLPGAVPTGQKRRTQSRCFNDCRTVDRRGEDGSGAGVAGQRVRIGAAGERVVRPARFRQRC